MNELLIESMNESDWPEVRAILEEGIATGRSTFETKSPDWPTWDAKHLKHTRLVARQHGALVGWVALAPVSSRAVYAGVAELSIYVAARRRGEGIGKALLQSAIAVSEEHGIWTLQTGTFPENVASVRLQQGCGFRIVGRRERTAKLNGQWRDILLIERRSHRVGMD